MLVPFWPKPKKLPIASLDPSFFNATVPSNPKPVAVANEPPEKPFSLSLIPSSLFGLNKLFVGFFSSAVKPLIAHDTDFSILSLASYISICQELTIFLKLLIPLDI